MKSYNLTIFFWCIIIGLPFSVSGLDKNINHCTKLLTPIEVTDTTFERNIQEHALFYVSCNHAQTLDYIKTTFLHHCTFKTIQKTLLPSKFEAGNCQIWILFKLKNPYAIPQSYVLSGNINGNKYWLFENENQFSPFIVDQKRIFLPHQNFSLNGHNRTVISIAAKAEIYVLYLQNSPIYDATNAVPKLSHGAIYESRYLYKYNSIIYFYLIASTLFFSMMLITALYYYLFRRKEMLLYLLYLFAILFVNYRTFEWYDLYGNFTIGHITWFASKVFHTSAIFMSYAYFVYVFLQLKTTKAKPLLKIITGLVLIAIVLEIPLQWLAPHYSYILYFLLRNVISLIGFIFIMIIWKSVNPFSRYILIGTLIIILTDIASSFVSGLMSSIISTSGTIAEVLIFTVVLGFWTFRLFKNQLREMHESKMAVLQKNDIISGMRKEFSQDMHDELGTTVTKLMLDVYYHKVKFEGTNTKLYDNLLKNLKNLSSNIKDMVWLFDDGKTKISTLQAQIRQTCHDMLSDLPVPVVFEIDKPNEDIILPIDFKRHVLAIVKEALVNILKHSKSSKIILSNTFDGNFFQLKITNHIIDLLNTSRSSGYGISNMEQRLKRIHGILNIDKRDDSFSVSISIPLSKQFQDEMKD